MIPDPQQEAKRDISNVNFNVTLTGIEIDTILSAVGTATSLWAKNRRHMPSSFNLTALSSGCDKLTRPVEDDYQHRCISPPPIPPEPQLPNSTDLLLIAHDEWKRREERRHIHEEIPWVHGWISGFLTSRNFVQDRLNILHQQGDK